jgi:hypothetical protein
MAKTLVTIAVLLIGAVSAELRAGRSSATPGQTPTAQGTTGVAKRRSVQSIRGRVLAADTSRPIRRARVILAGGGVATRSMSTNQEGRFEFRDLPPGRYTLSAARNGYLHITYGQRRPDDLGRPLDLKDGENVEGVEIVLPRMSVIVGRVSDEEGEPLEQVSVTALRLVSTDTGRQLKTSGLGVSDATGSFRILGLTPGDYWILATTAETWSEEHGNQSELVSYEPTYYPGVASVQEAQRVRVGLGQELAGISLSLRRGRTSNLSGRVVSSRGTPLAGRTVYLSQQFITSSNGMGGGMMKTAASSVIAADGGFRLGNVPAGSYLLQVGVPSSAEGPAEAAVVPITASGSDVDGIAVTTSNGGRIRGVVESDTEPVEGVPVRRVRLWCQPLSDTLVPFTPDPTSGQVSQDRSFVISGVFEPCLIRGSSLPEGWGIKGVYVSGWDATDVPIEVRASDEIRMRVVLSERIPGLTGAVTTDRNTPAADYVVVAFADDAGKWGPNSRFVRAGRPDQDGRFQLRGLPAGNYWVVALDDIEPGTWRDMEVLRALRPLATYVSLSEGDTTQIDLKIRSLP